MPKRIIHIYDLYSSKSAAISLLKLMDTIWKEGGVDYKMTLYNCIPTAVNEGLIEVVQGRLDIELLTFGYLERLLPESYIHKRATTSKITDY